MIANVQNKEVIIMNFYGETDKIVIKGTKNNRGFIVKKIKNASGYEHSGPSLADIQNGSYSGSSFDNRLSMSYNIVLKK